MIATNNRIDRTGDMPDALAASRQLRQVVCFTLGEQTYGIGIEAVREIRAWSPTTALPSAPDFVRGVINLRGTIVPILDLRARFSQGRTEPTKSHVVIVTQIGEQVVGVLVDSVSDIVKVAAADIRDVPAIGGGKATETLDGLVSVHGRMIALISAERILPPTVLH